MTKEQLEQGLKCHRLCESIRGLRADKSVYIHFINHYAIAEFANHTLLKEIAELIDKDLEIQEKNLVKSFDSL